MTTASPDAWLLDTDIQIHRLAIDSGLRTAAEAKRVARTPVAVTAYSLLEFKGNYIADLILLQRKVKDSADIEEVFARVAASGNRKHALMVAQLVKLARAIGFNFAAPVSDWPQAQGAMLTLIDGEITSVWHWFKSSVDRFVDDLDCTRATEHPFQDRGGWVNERPHCTTKNTKCRIVQLFKDNDVALRALLAALKSAGAITKELTDIVEVLEAAAKLGSVQWEGRTCRAIGDLLIGLHAPPRQGLVTSNSAEHSSIAPALQYNVDLLTVGGTRLI